MVGWWVGTFVVPYGRLAGKSADVVWPWRLVSLSRIAGIDFGSVRLVRLVRLVSLVPWTVCLIVLCLGCLVCLLRLCSQES